MSDKKEYFLGTGRRKTAVARIRVTSGQGKITVMGRPLDEYFSNIAAVEAVRAPLVAVGCLKSVDVFVNVHGGGGIGQAAAAQLGVARALIKSNSDFEDVLREKKYLTRDARKKERKKYGRAGARRSFQFSKR